MPLIQITLAEGRTPKQLRELIHGVTEVAIETANASRDTVTVIVTEVAADLWANAGITVQERRDAAKGA